MIPIRDSIQTGSTPYLTIGLIVMNVVIFLVEATGDTQAIIYKYGYIPAELVGDSEEFAQELRRNPPRKPVTDGLGRHLVDFFGRPATEPDRGAISAAKALPAWINIFTCMFLHGTWMHLLGNMLYLWIFGNNIEDRLGPILFLIFYLGTGIVGNVAHTVFEPGLMPLVGASGAISGVMGGYILLFPRARILALAPVGWYPIRVNLPAWAFLGIYFLIQNIYPAYFSAGGNVAYWAHIGGFVSGAALIYAFPHRAGPSGRRPAHREFNEEDADVVI